MSLKPQYDSSATRVDFRPPLPVENLYLRRFEAADATAISSWICSAAELTYLAPGTTGPLTPEKVIAWGAEREQRMILAHPQSPQPIGYAELNRMPNRIDQMWIGHFIINPAYRHQSLGVRFVTSLLQQAFEHHASTEVLLVVFPENKAAISCYERAGMVAEGQERKSFPATKQEHLFLRMGIHVRRFQQLRSSFGHIPVLLRV